MSSTRIRLWDLPTRVFHWSLVFFVSAALMTGELEGDWIEWHARIGLVVLGLLVFRLVWGVFGSTYARFAQFFPTPARIKAYLQGEWQGEGHNPLGALAVFALLGLLTAQVLSGLVANDDLAFTGPHYALVGKIWSDRLTKLHHLLSDALIWLIGLHVAAILFYGHIKKRKLLKAMISGWKENGEGESARGGGPLAFSLALALALAAVYGAAGGLLMG